MHIEWDQKVFKKLGEDHPILSDISKTKFISKLSGTKKPWQGTVRESGASSGRLKYKKYRKVEIRNSIGYTNVLIVLQLSGDGSIGTLFSINGKLRTDSAYFREIAAVIDEGKKVLEGLIA